MRAATCAALSALAGAGNTLGAAAGGGARYDALEHAAPDASFLGKIAVGASESVRLMLKIIAGEPEVRPPTKIQVALVGFGRTGTTSMVSAMRQLGYTPLHDDEYPDAADLFKELYDEHRPMPMEQLATELGKRGFDAPFFYTPDFIKWAATAPGVKVVLTTRDKRKWAESWQTVAWHVDVLYSWPFIWSQIIQDLMPVTEHLCRNITTNGSPENYLDLATLEAGYEAHVRMVRETIPRDRLLEFDVKQGWAPLCAFLGKPVPTTGFPHINDRLVVAATLYTMYAITFLWPLLPLLPLLLFRYLYRRCCRGRRPVAEERKKEV